MEADGAACCLVLSALEGCVPGCGSLSFLSLFGIWQHLRTPAAMGSTGPFQSCSAVPHSALGSLGASECASAAL